MLDRSDQITIIGVGLLGGSIGLALKAADWRGKIVGCGRTRRTLERAQARGCIDDFHADAAEAVRGSGLVVLAAPVRAIIDGLTAIAGAVDADAVITDVGSTKGAICAAARQTLPQPRRFVGSHPMAGGEQHGPDHADAALLRDRLCITTPTDDTDPATLEAVEALWCMVGMKIIRTSPAEHDALVAAVSHLPHAAAAMLVDVAVDCQALDVAATGFRDTTRIASSDPKLWLDIFMTNRDAVVKSIDRFTDKLTALRNALAHGDEKAILDELQRAKTTRDRWLLTPDH